MHICLYSSKTCLASRQFKLSVGNDTDFWQIITFLKPLTENCAGNFTWVDSLPIIYLYLFGSKILFHGDNVDKKRDKMVSSDFGDALGIQIPRTEFCFVVSIFLITRCHHKILYCCILFRHQSHRNFATWPLVSVCLYSNL